MQAQANMNIGMPNCSILFIEYDTQRVNICEEKRRRVKNYGRNVFDTKPRNAQNSTFLLCIIVYRLNNSL